MFKKKCDYCGKTIKSNEDYIYVQLKWGGIVKRYHINCYCQAKEEGFK